MIKTSRREFQTLVSEVLEALPVEFSQRISKVEIVVESEPPPDIREKFPRGILLGLYQGTPLTGESTFRSYSMPNRISLYQQNIERICSSRSQIREQVRKTLLHEIGHHFGLKEGDLRKAGY